MRRISRRGLACLALAAAVGCADNGGGTEATSPGFVPTMETEDPVGATSDAATPDPVDAPDAGEVADMDAAVPPSEQDPEPDVELPEACEGTCEIFTCRYKAIGGTDACTDYYGHHGWTAETASEHCQLEETMTTDHITPLAAPDQPDCVTGGALGDGTQLYEASCSTRSGADKPYVSFGAPQGICTAILEGTHSEPALARVCTPGEELSCDTPDLETPDAGDDTDAGASDAGPVDDTPDGETYRCEYNNAISPTRDPQCRQYNGSWNAESAEADCLAHPIGEDMVFAQGACPTDGTHGYCTNQRGDLEVAYTGGCVDDNSVQNGVWACKNFGDTDANGASIPGVWTCTLEQPPYRCGIDDAQDGQVACRDFPPGSSEATAAAGCDDGVVEQGRCDASGDAATCTLDDGVIEHVQGDDFADCATAEPDCAGSFVCNYSSPEVFTCTVSDTGLGCSFLGGDYVCAACLDFPVADGFTESTAQAACDEYVASLGQAGASATLTRDAVTACERDFFCPHSSGGRLYYETDPDDVQTPGSVDECPSLGCPPEEADVITCRYSSSPVPGITANNCIDFLAADGWTVELVDAHCRNGGDNPTTPPQITGCLSCLEEKGDTDRCVGTREQDGLSFYAYDTPQVACDNIEGGVLQSPPHAAYP